MGRRTLLINIVLLAALGLAASYLVSQWQQFEESTTLETLVRGGGAVETPAAGGVAQREGGGQLTAFAEIGERPLFRPERRPPEVAGEDAPIQRPEPPNAEMTGSSVFGGVARATLKIAPPRGRGAAQNLNVSTGDSPPPLNGWRVASVRPTAVTLQWNDEQIQFDLVPAPVPERQQAATTSGVNIINVGQAAPAVETSSAEAAQETQRGLQVAVVANQNQQSGNSGGARRGGVGAAPGGAGTASPAAAGARSPTRRPNRPNRPNNN